MVNGSKLGRVRIAADTAIPPRNAARAVPVRMPSDAASHQAVAGTSLIGCRVWKRNTGLTASSAAPHMPVVASCRRRPIRKVSQTQAAPNRATTPDAAAGIRLMELAAAIARGRPGG